MPDPTRAEREEAKKILAELWPRDPRQLIATALHPHDAVEVIARALAARRFPLTESDVERALRAVPMMPFSIPWFPDYPAMARAVLALRGGKET